jgi:hypothetical protein
MPRWSAAQMLSWIALGKPLKLKEWPNAMEGRILPAQLKLHEAIVQRRITDVRGRLGPPGSKERIEELLSDSEFTLLVTPHGTLTVHPPHQRHKFEKKYGIDLDNWVREIDFDRDEGEQAFPPSPVPCQGRPDRPHLRLLPGVLPARSGEANAPAQPPAPAADAAPTSGIEVEPEGLPSTTQQTVAEPASAASGELLGALNLGGRPTDRDLVLGEADWRLRRRKTQAKSLAAFARELREWLQDHGEHRGKMTGEVMKPETIEGHVRPLWNRYRGKPV